MLPNFYWPQVTDMDFSCWINKIKDQKQILKIYMDFPTTFVFM